MSDPDVKTYAWYYKYDPGKNIGSNTELSIIIF